MASRYYGWCLGDVHYIKRGLGDPLLLVHNVYPGASHEEFVHNIDDLARHFTVYAIDLLGFGGSDAPRRKYTARMYVDLIEDFVRDEIRDGDRGSDEPVHVMSAGLSCAYVAAAAARASELFNRLVFVCPRSEPTGMDLPRWAAPIRHFMLTVPGCGSGYYETVAGEYALRRYLANCFYNSRAIAPELIERLHENAWRPGSIHPYASLLTGYLDHPLLGSLPKVINPLLLVWGRQARPTPVEHSVRFLALAQNARLEIIEKAGSWVHDEQSAQVDRVVVEYLNQVLPAVPAARAQTA